MSSSWGSGGGGGDDWHHFPFNTSSPPSLWSLNHLSPGIQRHLVRVYTNLTATLGAAVGANAAVLLGYLPALTWLPFVISLLFVLGMSVVRPAPNNSITRQGLLYGFGFSYGWLLSPVIHQVFAVDPSTILLALMATAIGFLSFSANALFTQRRSQLYLGSLLGALLGVTTLLSLARLFFPASFTHSLLMSEIYLGLFIFCGYIMYDTQLIVERAAQHQNPEEVDAVTPAMTLFTDFVGVFVRIMLILQERAKKQREDEQNKKRRPRRLF